MKMQTILFFFVSSTHVAMQARCAQSTFHTTHPLWNDMMHMSEQSAFTCQSLKVGQVPSCASVGARMTAPPLKNSVIFEVRLKGVVKKVPAGTTRVPPPAFSTASTPLLNASVFRVVLSPTAPNCVRLKVGPTRPPKSDRFGCCCSNTDATADSSVKEIGCSAWL